MTLDDPDSSPSCATAASSETARFILAGGAACWGWRGGLHVGRRPLRKPDREQTQTLISRVRTVGVGRDFAGALLAEDEVAKRFETRGPSKRTAHEC